MKVRVSNIQRFCLHDGPGIRTTVFLKGCFLKCPWCCNPENIDYKFNEYLDDNNNKKVFGYDININDLYNKLEKDFNFFRKTNGGITFSGGESLNQINKLEKLLIKLKEEKINICFETSLYTKIENVELVAKYADYIIVDLKTLIEDDVKKILSGDLNTYINNFNYLNKLNKISIVRIPLAKNYTLKEENIDKILKFLNSYKGKIEIFKIHNFALKKYLKLNREYLNFEDISIEEIDNILNKFKKKGLNIEYIEI